MYYRNLQGKANAKENSEKILWSIPDPYVGLPSYKRMIMKDNHLKGLGISHDVSWGPEKIYLEVSKVSWPSVDDISSKSFYNTSKNFYNLYFEGIAHEECREFDIILEMLSWAACRNSVGRIVYLFRGKEALYKKADLWYQESFEMKDTVRKTDQLFKPVTVIDDAIPINFQFQTRNFKDWVYSRIQKSGETFIDEELCLVTTCLVLIMFSSIVKSKQKMISSFNEKVVTHKIRNSTNINLKGIYQPPAEKLFDDVYDYSARLRKNFIQGFYEIFSIYYYSVKTLETNGIGSNFIELLDKTCMSDTKFNGLQLVKHVQEVCDLFHITTKDLSKNFEGIEFLDDSWKCYEEYENKLLKPGAIEYSAPWCRLYSEDYFSDLRAKYHTRFLSVLAGMISTKSGPGIWQSAWAKNEISILTESFGAYGVKLAEGLNSL